MRILEWIVVFYLSEEAGYHYYGGMKILKINSDFPGEYQSEIEMAVQVLRHGGVVMHPTETCYGLAADIFNEKALERLYALKKMDRSKPVSIMVNSAEAAKMFAEFYDVRARGAAGEGTDGAADKGGARGAAGEGTDGAADKGGARGAAGEILTGGLTALFLAEKFWPGPLTLVLPRRDTLPMFLNAGIESVGIRCPGNNFCLDLIKAFGGPLTTTSANLSGCPEVYEVESYLHQLMSEQIKPDLILDGGILSKRKPSTIVKFNGRDLDLIREGELWAYIRGSV
jgi:L-threonylcarbamoyladenylate synthase